MQAKVDSWNCLNHAFVFGRLLQRKACVSNSRETRWLIVVFAEVKVSGVMRVPQEAQQRPIESLSLGRLSVCCLFAAIGAWYFRGDLFFHLLAIPAALLLLLPTVAFLRTSFGKGVAVYFSIVAMSWIVGWGMNRYDIGVAMEFPRRARPAIEAYLRTHSELPDDLSGIPGVPPIPRTLNVHTDGTEVSYRIDSRVSVYDSWSYRASDDTWHHFSL